MTRAHFGFVIALVLLAIPLLVGHSFYINVASQILIAAVLALSLNLLVGYAGLTSLGHAAFLGLGAYSVAWLTVNTSLGPALSVLLGLCMVIAVAALFGVMALRATGITFLMITLAIGQTLWGVAYRFTALTGGDNGIPGIRRPVLLGFDLGDPRAFYVAMILLFVTALGAMHLFVRSGLGMSLQGARDQPRRMRALGHNVRLIQWLAFVVAGFWGGIAGVAFLYYHGFISPHAMGLPSSAEALLMVIAGGAGTLLGPVVGAFIVVVLKTVVSAYVTRWMTLLGVTFIVIVVFVPEGIVPGIDKLRRRLGLWA